MLSTPIDNATQGFSFELNNYVIDVYFQLLVTQSQRISRELRAPQYLCPVNSFPVSVFCEQFSSICFPMNNWLMHQ